MVLLDLPHSADYFLSAFRTLPKKPQIVERTRDIAVMQGLVGQGFGFSIANMPGLSNLSPDGRPLRYVPLSGPLRPMQLGLLTTEGSLARRTTRAFAEHVKGALGPTRT
jgi:DNA-binding transcriptional LysR family regulator